MDNTKEEITEAAVNDADTQGVTEVVSDIVEDSLEDTSEDTAKESVVPKKRKKIGKIILRSLYVFLITLVFIVSLLYGTMWIMVNGPSQEIRRLFVLSVKETSAAGFLANMYLSQEEIDAIINTNGADSSADIDTSLIKIEHTTVDKDATGEGSSDSADQGNNKNEQDIEIVNVSGPSYNGKLMIVKDPSRVFVGVPDRFGSDASGLTLKNMISKYDAVGGINAGGFYDPNGMGSGGGLLHKGDGVLPFHKRAEHCENDGGHAEGDGLFGGEEAFGGEFAGQQISSLGCIHERVG